MKSLEVGTSKEKIIAIEYARQGMVSWRSRCYDHDKGDQNRGIIVDVDCDEGRKNRDKEERRNNRMSNTALPKVGDEDIFTVES